MEGAEAFAKSQRHRELATDMKRPAVHARAIQKHQYRAKKLAAEAKAAARAVRSAHFQMARTLTRDVGASFVASPGSVGMAGALPPEMLEPKPPGPPHTLLEPDAPLGTAFKLEMRISANRRVYR